jgi:hypothetical protein
MSINTSEACIIIASHISNPKRIDHLSECLHSLLNQTCPIAIYLSISFENENLQQTFAEIFSKTPEFSSPFMYLLIKPTKTPQMRHMYELLPLIEKSHNWIMFCDDDDTYEPTRVETFLKNIASCLRTVKTQMPDKRFIGVYESTFGKDHRQQRHESARTGPHKQGGAGRMKHERRATSRSAPHSQEGTQNPARVGHPQNGTQQ